MSEQPAPDVIEVYLDALLARLRGASGDVRRALVECEAHLRDSAAAFEAQHMGAEQAATAAVEAFGPPAIVAASFNREAVPRALRHLVRPLARVAARMAGVGLLTIGASGLGVWLLSAIVGAGPVFRNAPGVRLDPGSCAHFLAVQPAAQSCAQAALWEGRDDSIVQRSAAGLLGLLILVALRVCGHRRQTRALRLPASAELPALVMPSIGFAVFGLTGLYLAGYGVDRAVIGSGAGQFLVSAGVALVVAGGYARRAHKIAIG